MQAFKAFWRSIYVSYRFLWALGGLAMVFLVAYFFPWLLTWAYLALTVFVLLSLLDFFLLFSKKGIEASRNLPNKLSNGDDNSIFVDVDNLYGFEVKGKIIDEVPIQFQKRDFDIRTKIAAKGSNFLKYTLRPIRRGEYAFGALNFFAQSPLGLIERRFIFDKGAEIPVYPSFLQMRKYELLAISNRLKEYGLKKIRRIGQSQEFEQIREYVQGDDIRHINWKATARKQDLMVNQFTDERSQKVYCIIDKGRLMKSPFEEMTLLDYSINSSLVMSNIVLKHHNKAGLVTFANDVDTYLPAVSQRGQLLKIMNLLYAQKTDFLESSFEHLFVFMKRRITRRSLVILYTNFQTISSLRRNLKFLRTVAKKHLLAVVVFKNTELDDLINTKPGSVQEIYTKTIGQKFEFESRQIVKELQANGIHTIYTAPNNLSVNTLNKYLELRARGLFN
ncbi:MAG: DUF58 domain-containing protein [Saprospiraceae bacterium]|nr:DUF58 domain-containing protein [Saprospiraceae bacterium]